MHHEENYFRFDLKKNGNENSVGKKSLAKIYLWICRLATFFISFWLSNDFFFKFSWGSTEHRRANRHLFSCVFLSVLANCGGGRGERNDASRKRNGDATAFVNAAAVSRSMFIFFVAISWWILKRTLIALFGLNLLRLREDQKQIFVIGLPNFMETIRCMRKPPYNIRPMKSNI